MPPRVKLVKKPFFFIISAILQGFCCSFDLYAFSLLLKMTYACSWPESIMASLFNAVINNWQYIIMVCYNLCNFITCTIKNYNPRHNSLGHLIIHTLLFISCSLIGSISGVATGVAECHPWQRKFAKNLEKIGEKSGKIGKKEEKSGRKGKNQEVSFTLPLLTDRAGYATELISN